MPNKTAILENVDMYSADELVGYIKDGIVTYDELCEETDGCFSAAVRKEVEKKLKGSEDEDWQKAIVTNTIEAFERYLSVYEEGAHREEARSRIKELQTQAMSASARSAWDAVNKNDIKELRAFCESHPSDPHIVQARKRINELRREDFIGYDQDSLIKQVKRIQTDRDVVNPDDEIFKVITNYLNRKKISHKDLLDIMKSDHNVFRASVVNMLLDDGLLDYDDFEKIGIKSEFVSHLANGDTTQSFAIPQRLERINKLSTEVYFWGIPSSGKSCALGAILSVANNGRVANSMRKDGDCQGFGYMTRLSSLFNLDGEVGTLPEGTSIYSTYEMGFDLEDKDGATHPITCVDLAGELVRCMFKFDAHESMSEDEVQALDTLTNVLIDNRSQNMKIHFFVLEYGADDRKYEGLTQKEYLDGALGYIERTGVFKNDTNAIYIIVTKVDKAKATKGQLGNVLREYISDRYAGFYNGLKNICKQCEINNGEVEIIPFSLGDVCFQSYCLFDSRPAENVVRLLLERSKGFKNDKFHRFTKYLKK